jgi:cellulose synthase/poly-beta-1,6-N-acetylglucosamine synthase-like glycosyltransferase
MLILFFTSFFLSLVGLLGILMMSVLFPLMAILIYGVRKTFKLCETQNDSITPQEPSKLKIIIPTHNEEDNIAITLSSIFNQTGICNRETSNNLCFKDIEITVVLDGCSDSTRIIAEQYQNVKFIVHERPYGKWWSIKEACQLDRSASWIALVDAGTYWPPDLLAELNHFFSNPHYVGLAPAYRNTAASFVEAVSWEFERSLKALENHAGGPISVHGATVFYRTNALMEAFECLEDNTWLNDDVVLPLTIRSLFPFKKLQYLPQYYVEDRSKNGEQKDELTRRKRMTKGNLEWIVASFWRKDILVRILALRRIARLMWAYWILCILSLLFLLGTSGVLLFFLISIALYQLSPFRASLGFLGLLFHKGALSWK